ncbi:MAG: HTH-type transcriptional repressor NsrR [Thermoanaerobaculia bacterium]|nr:HTH-type transcriptional repressor NsrR [Thermoanaerobaculia bacterium]
MLGIRRETDYAVRILIHLAAIDEKSLVQVRTMAEQRFLPLSFVRRIVARLSAAGLLSTMRGMGGGIQLARPASQISMLDVVRAMGDGVELNQCLDGDHHCPFSGSCPAQTVWQETTALVEAHLASVRFDVLAGHTGHGDAHRRLAKPGPTDKVKKSSGTKRPKKKPPLAGRPGERSPVASRPGQR